ncbi:RagB/SusD family nutrient uptake outer membrane protein [Chitinophaga silvisoli]|nr:RagB/SusD family nutrient uptake outer membrane protein [Chitinophaga silvisoli]
MNYTINRKTISLIILLLGITSCSKHFLEVDPKGSLVASSVSDYDQLLNNLYVIYINSNAQVPMGDEMAGMEPYFSQANYRTQRLFRWDDVVYESNDDAAEFTNTMLSIYEFNKIINEVETATDGTESQKASLKAEAQAGRAWTYFLMINYYGLPYSATSATDLGFPIITAADITQTEFKRATVKEVYDFIINDLTAAIPKLPAKTTSRLRMSKAAAEGILGKVYVFMGNYQDGLTWLNAAINDMSNSSIAVGLYDLQTETATGGIYDGTSVPPMTADIENILVKQSTCYWSYIYDELVLSPAASALFDPTDLRLKFYSDKTYGGYSYPVSGILRKNRFSAFDFGVLVPDLYLLRAECECRLNDLASAKTDVETLRKKRLPIATAPVPDSISGEKISLLKFILDERTREFAVTGTRWFDMRRLSTDPLFSGNTYLHTIYSEDGSSTQITLRPERLVLRFPQKIVQQSSGLINNP